MVVDVAEVPLVLCGRDPAARRSRPSVERTCRAAGYRFPQANKQALHLKDLLQLLVVGLEEDRVLELVDAVVEGCEDGEEAVDQPVDDPVEQQRRLFNRLVASLIAAADLGKRGAVVAMDSDEKSLGVEAMHLDKPVVVRRRAIDDDEDEVVVLVELRPLAELLRVLDRERMELEDIAKDLKVRLARSIEVEPEKATVREQALDGVDIEADLAAAVIVDDVTDRGPRVIGSYVGSIRVAIEMRFQALIAVIAQSNWPSSSSAKCSAASFQTMSGTCSSVISVVESVRASAARSRSLKKGVSRQAARA